MPRGHPPRQGRYRGLTPAAERILGSDSEDSSDWSEDDSGEESGPRRSTRIFLAAGNPEEVEMVEKRTIEYEDLIAPEMGMRFRYQLCQHCYAKNKYTVTGLIQIEGNKKPKFVETTATPITQFSIIAGGTTNESRVGVFSASAPARQIR